MEQRFVRHTGLVVPLDRVNVDTDQIMPKQFLKRIERTGFGEYLFHDWRMDPEFELNQPRYAGASVLVAGKNFGCGSSREHAPWGLAQYGFRVLIAPSFADIFYSNCFKNFMLPVVLSEAQVADLMSRTRSLAGYALSVDLEAQLVTDGHGFRATFEVDPFRRYCLLNGLDDIGLTLQQEAAIAAFEARRPRWMKGSPLAGAAATAHRGEALA
ncbi:MAG: 3-isopropylmalate dehydratase, small subunit [Symbiobacteriaceae bacterium]|jgi:3-isopropylmalate/(R)-2-methylmalate dehydratase small subunit|nr:3-isopropylmalate dehydratase, small subunit [Symbiobacteriaceae bacterium]